MTVAKGWKQPVVTDWRKIRLEGLQSFKDVVGQRLPEIIANVQKRAANIAVEKLRSFHSSSFPKLSTGNSYNTIMVRPVPWHKFEIIKGSSVRHGMRYYVGYYPNFASATRNLAPGHGVRDYMGMLNNGIKPGRILVPSPGVSGAMSPDGWQRLRQWADTMGLAQGNRPYTVKRLRKRKEGTVGRPTKYRTYSGKQEEKTYQANPTRQLWIIVKSMQKRGVPNSLGRTYRGTHHIDRFTHYIRSQEGLVTDIANIMNDEYNKLNAEIAKSNAKVRR